MFEGPVFKAIGPERAHNLFIRSRAKKGFKLPLTNFKINELETQSSLQSKELIIRISPIQIQLLLPILSFVTTPCQFIEIKTSYQVSERRACKSMEFARLTIRYESVADPRNALRMRLRELAAARVGYGYRHLHILQLFEFLFDLIDVLFFDDHVLADKMPYTNKIIKAGALISDTKAFFSVWDPKFSITENLERIRNHNLLGITSRSQTEDIPTVLMQGYLTEEIITWALSLPVRSQTNGDTSDRILYFHTARADSLIKNIVVEFLSISEIKIYHGER